MSSSPSKQYDNLTKPIGSYSSYIARKVAIENLYSLKQNQFVE